MFVAHFHEMGGGAEVVLDEYVRIISQEADDVEVLVVVPASGNVSDRMTRYGAMVTVVSQPRWADFGSMTPIKAPIRIIWILSRIWAARRLIKQWRPDVVLTNTMTIPAFAIAARTLKIPHVWMIHEFGKRDHDLSFALGYRRTIRLIGRLSTKVICCSNAVRDELAFSGISETKLLTIYCATDTASVCESPTKRKSYEQLRTIVVGRIAPSKGQLLALQGISEAREMGADVSIDFVGSEFDHEYVAMIRSLHVEGVRFIGYVDDPTPYYCRADVALMCSSDEAFGRVTVEAMKLGLPVIGLNSGGTNEIIVDGRSGYLIPPNDPSALAGKLRRLWADEVMRSEMGRQAQADALRRFSPTQAMNELLEVCRAVQRTIV
jgi:glycosyltransferase involved in cell wall biosynthesis